MSDDSLLFPRILSEFNISGIEKKLSYHIPLQICLNLFNDFYEIDEFRTIPILYSSGDRALDIGCGMGFITIILANLCDYVIGIEALDNYAAVARTNIELNNLESKAHIISAAVDTEDRWAKYYSRTLAYGSSLLPPRGSGFGVDNGEEIEVDTMDISELVYKYDINAIHMDVEGYEAKLVGRLVETSSIAKINKLSMEIHTHLLSRQLIFDMYSSIYGAGLVAIAIANPTSFPNNPYVISFCRMEETQRIIEGGTKQGGIGMLDPDRDNFLSYIEEWAKT